MQKYPKLVSVVPAENYHLKLTYANGEKRIYDFRKNLDHPFFSALANESLFKKVAAVDGEVEWATGQDFCPHTLYDDSVPLQHDAA